MSRPAIPAAAALAATLIAALAPAAHAQPGVQHFASPASPAPAATSPAQTLRQARRAFRQGAGGGPRADLSPVLQRLALQLPQLTGAQAREARRLLARPTDGSADPQDSGYATSEAPGSPSCGPNFCVHWVATGEDAPDPTDANGNNVPDYVDLARDTSENVHNVENGQLGWREPKSDGALGGGDGQVDVYLKQLGGQGLYGYAAPDPNQQPTKSDHSLFAYLVLDNDFQKSEFPTYQSPTTPLEVTLAHEYNHVLQFTYDFLQDTWFLESTATWMEGKVYPAAFDYLQYLPGWVRLQDVPLTQFNSNNRDDRANVKVYGTSVWNKWLDNRYGQEVVRGAWEDSIGTSPQSFGVAAYDQSIREHRGKGFAAEFSRFAAATAEWQATGSGFPEGSRYPEVPRVADTPVNGSLAGKLNHTTYALVDVGASSAPRIKLGVRAPAGVASAVALVGLESGTNQATVTVRDMPKGGVGSVTLDDPSRFNRVTAVLINADTRVIGASDTTGDWIYRADNQAFAARVSTDFTPPRIRTTSPRAGSRTASVRSRVKVTFDERVMGVDRKSVRLVAANGRTVRTRLSFRRGSRSVTLTPARALGRDRVYRVRVTRGVTDLSFNSLARTTIRSFRTAR